MEFTDVQDTVEVLAEIRKMMDLVANSKGFRVNAPDYEGLAVIEQQTAMAGIFREKLLHFLENEDQELSRRLQVPTHHHHECYTGPQMTALEEENLRGSSHLT
jgi:hypothetical protein